MCDRLVVMWNASPVEALIPKKLPAGDMPGHYHPML
jgi:hypothetical protein